ncbi:MAG: exodeoxyribonuclease VII small subunit [Clostridia bacterium]|nr:exodeoxyribonuclease VII small subunit [Clostridia bacterium]
MKQPTYEQAMERLSVITEQLENGSLPLGDSLKLYEEASALVRLCNTYLDTAEQKIVSLAESEDAADA